MTAPLIASVTSEALTALRVEQRAKLRYAWDLFARESQKPPPGDWITWLYMAGRGAGKTRTASEWVRQRVNDGAQRIALLGRTPADVRDVMVEGDSGLLNVFPPPERPNYEPSNRRIVFHTGAVGHVYSSEQPDHLRGPQHDTAWCDELATFKGRDAWDNLQLGLRLGTPRQIVTTTPKPVAAMRELVGNPNTVLTRDTSYANRANLAPAFFDQVIQMYEGTSRGQQEIEGMLLDSLPGALWTREMIRYRKETPKLPLTRVIGVDPSIGDGETSDECGIVGVGLADDGKLDVLGDWSVRASPLKWAERVVKAYHEIEADYIVIERNSGGRLLLKANIDSVEAGLPIRTVWAKEAKEMRASNPALKYELGQVYHAKPMPELEDQLCTWIPWRGAVTRQTGRAGVGRPISYPAAIPNRYGGAMKAFKLGCGLILFGMVGVPVLLLIIVIILMALGVETG